MVPSVKKPNRVSVFKMTLVFLALVNYLYSQTDNGKLLLEEVGNAKSAYLSNSNEAHKNWSAGLEVFSGYVFYTGDLNKSFKSYIPIGVAINAHYKKLEVSLRNSVGFNKTKTAFDYQSVALETGNRLGSFLSEASLGYTVYDTNRLKLFPYVGIGGIRINPIKTDGEQAINSREALLKSTTYNLGMNLDVKFEREKTAKIASALRIRYAYVLQNSKNNIDITGDVHYITIGYFGEMSW